MHSLRLRLLAVTTSLALAALLGAAGPAAAQDRPANATTSAYERTFLEQMSVHHHMAVMMSEICVDRAAELEPGLVALCSGIVQTQEHEIDSMVGWLADWYGVTDFSPHAHMGGDMMGMMDTMRSMPADQFQRFYLEDMIVHHAGALQPARQCKGRAAHEELRRLCAGIVDTQTAEIDQMRTMLCDWYGECNYWNDPHRRKAMMDMAG
ncbi:MAG TPA: DUF305 domain-containing protein [Acidimicrobiales bacterium]|nr:DUF305 domain-containing protein [Acidimicrobiales bacterium]